MFLLLFYSSCAQFQIYTREINLLGGSELSGSFPLGISWGKHEHVETCMR